MPMTTKKSQFDLRLNDREKWKDSHSLKEVFDFTMSSTGIAHNMYKEEGDLLKILGASLRDLLYNVPLNFEPKGPPYTMVNLEEMQRVALAIRNGSHTGTTCVLWNLCMANAEWETGRVKLDRDELAELASVSSHQVSRSMKLLHEYGAVFQFKRHGRVFYECSPIVGWSGKRMSEIQRRAYWIKQEVERRAAKALEQGHLGI